MHLQVVLDSLTLDLPPHTVVAVVGPSGSGMCQIFVHFKGQNDYFLLHS